MQKVSHPKKELVRDWLDRQREKGKPLPSMEEIKRELGWKMIQEQQKLKPPR